MNKKNTGEPFPENEQHRIRELEQEVEVLGGYIKLIERKDASKKSDLSETTIKDDLHKTKELEQEKIILQELNKSLEEKTELDINKFLTMISHELKTPLVPIKAYAEMLEEGKFGEVGEIQKQKLKAIDDNARELIQLVSNMSEYQKFSLGKVELHKELIDIKKIIHDAHMFFSLELDSRGMKIDSTFSKPLWIMCDASRMHQVLTNLLQIALYSIPKNSGKIAVSVWENEKEVIISVRHNGERIAPNDFKKIFTEFYKVDTSNIRSNGGIGLALALCKQIIDAHGGKIWVSDAEKGTTISFTIPKNVN